MKHVLPCQVHILDTAMQLKFPVPCMPSRGMTGGSVQCQCSQRVLKTSRMPLLVFKCSYADPPNPKQGPIQV